MVITEFPVEVSKKLGSYVYRLIDPRNGETFYVGKGKDSRVFSHANDKLSNPDLSDKLKRIREIRNANFEVAHIIHRHGLSEQVAFEVEAALMDAYPGLTNVAGGTGSSDFGAMHAAEIVRRYAAPEAVFKHKALLIKVNRSATEDSLYEATRYAWVIDPIKANKAEVILAVVQGLIVGAFNANRWIEATEANFPGRETLPGRFAFEGAPASAEISHIYMDCRIPAQYRKRGAASPIRYTW